MGKFKENPLFFTEDTNRSLETLNPELRIWNDFEEADLERDVSEVSDVLAVESHPKIGRIRVKLRKRAGDKKFPGFSLHSKSLVWFDLEEDTLYLFKTQVTIMGAALKTEEIDSDEIEAYYFGRDGRVMHTYTDRHTGG